MDISDLYQEYQKRKKEIKSRLKEFQHQKDYFYELCFCLLTPQSNAFKCDECIKVLKGHDFARKDMEIENILKKYTRFHKNKSKYLIRIKDAHEKIFNTLSKIENPKDKRDFIVENIKGLGLKEASHFLRNTGHRNLAILDRHILNELKSLDVIDKIPSSLTRKKYLEIEEEFHKFADRINIPMDELDLLFWSINTGKVFK